MDLQLTGKTALVTGATSGIGRGIALALGREGVRLAIAGRNAAQLAQVADEIVATGASRPETVTGDLAQPDGPARVHAAALGALGSISVLVNNAGGSRPQPAAGAEAYWDEAFALNFTAARRLAEASLPAMRAARWGRVINISGALAQKSVNAATPAKAALLSWSRSLAAEVARDGITVNCVAPGRIMSAQITERLYPTEAARAAFVAENIPIGRFGEPAELAALVAFLASPLAGYITGCSIPVDGGMFRLSLQ